MARFLKIPLFCMLAIALGACASGPAPVLVNPLAPESDLEKALDKRLNDMGYISRTPTKRIGYTRFSGWAYVDRQYITVTFGANKHFLIKFKAPCYDAEHAQTLRFETIMSSITPNDRAYLGRNARTMQPCWIDTLYELEKKPREKKAEHE